MSEGTEKVEDGKNSTVGSSKESIRHSDNRINERIARLEVETKLGRRVILIEAALAAAAIIAALLGYKTDQLGDKLEQAEGSVIEIQQYLEPDKFKKRAEEAVATAIDDLLIPVKLGDALKNAKRTCEKQKTVCVCKADDGTSVLLDLCFNVCEDNGLIMSVKINELEASSNDLSCEQGTYYEHNL